ncbi:hypothetical protein ACFQ2B_10740 [Streptomyces stramineus]|uniref:Lipoprotein n=1 Tax=Streptomyces stramineus TaxID=173861 RepID=A0ABN1ATP5_9ACTN
MRMRHTTKARRGAAVAALAAVTALTIGGCGGDDGDDGGGKGPAPGGKSATPQGRAKGGGEAKPDTVIGEMKGADGVVITLTSAVRDSGGFVTVNGTLTNRGSKAFHAIKWLSQEKDVKSRSSISGASLVDSTSKKRYLVLRDTDGECLCTTGLSNIKPQDSRPVFAQFPAPPAGVTEVDFQVPTMPSVRVKISG